LKGIFLSFYAYFTTAGNRLSGNQRAKPIFSACLVYWSTDLELGIDREPETVNGPKEVIKNAIRISRQNLTRRRRRDLTIEELYSLVGQKIELILLEKLPSYRFPPGCMAG
jgi:hypothetical protein